MSKTTIALFIILLLVLGSLFFIIYYKQQNPIIKSFAKPLISRLEPAQTTLSFQTSEQEVKQGKILTIDVLITNPNPHPNLAQLELAYNPTSIMIDSISPGKFFTKPAIVLQTIDPVAGRISYALRCPTSQTSDTNDCVNPSSSILATLTVTINPYTLQNITTISFLPKSVIRTDNGQDLLKKTNGLQLKILKPFFPISSSSAGIKPMI